MKKITSFFIALFALVIFASVALAASDYMNQKVITVASDEVIDKDFFIGAGDIVEIYGVVNGDVVVAGGQLLINGVINGDLLAAGGSISLSGEIAQDARIAGGQLLINGKIGRNLTAVGGNIEVAESAEIAGGAIFAGGNVTVEAPIGGEMYVGAGNLTLANQVDGNVQAVVGTLRLTSNAKINGDFTFYSDEDPLIDESAIVSGTITKRDPPQDFRSFDTDDIKGFGSGARSSFKLASFLTTLVFGLLMIRFVPNYTKGVAYTVRDKIWKSLGYGLLSLILIPVVAFILLITVIGFPIGLLFVFSYVFYIYLAKIFIAVCIGDYLYEKLGRNKTQYLPYVLGLVVYYVLTWIPIIGGLVNLVVLLLGLGAAVLYCRVNYPKALKSKII